MGSQLIKGYTIDKQSKGSIGATNNWRLHDATKQGTNQPASVLILQKKSLPKGEKQQILKMCKKQATSLVKFKHPYIISITEALLEDEHSMGFVVEKIQGNLKLLIQTGKFIEHCSSQLQLKIHILELIEALNFLHNNVKLVHLGINLNNIYITQDGKWKLGGFMFSQNIAGEALVDCESKPNEYTYMAPEVAAQSKCTYASDIFCLMTVAITLLQHIKHPSRAITPMINASNKSEYEKHKQIFLRGDKHPFISSSLTPNQLGRLASETLCWDWAKRRSLSQIQSSQWLTDNFTVTIKHLSSIINLQQKMQLQFLKGLSAMVLKFEPSLIKKKIIPTLLELMKFDYLVAGIVLTILEIMKKDIITVVEFQKSIWGPFKTLTQGKQISAHALYLFVSNIEIFAKYISLQDLNTTLIPLYVKCFDCPNKLKQLALRKVEFLSKKLQYQYIKSKILPKILSLFVDKSVEIRKLALICIYKSVSSYDPQVVTDLILPGLDKLRKAGSDSFSNAITLKLYILFSKNLSIQIIGNKIIPSLVPYLVDSGISTTDFELYKNTINSLMAKIQNERTKNPNVEEGVSYTEADFDFPIEEKQKEIIKTIVQPNFDFLSMFKAQQAPSRAQTPNIVQNTNIDFAGGSLDFNAFSAPIAASSKVDYNSDIYNTSLPKHQTSLSSNFNGFAMSGNQRQTLKPYQIPITKSKDLDTAANQFFAYMDDKPAQTNPQKPKINLKGPSGAKLLTPPPTVSPPVQSNISPPSQPLYSINAGLKTEVDPFADLQKQMNDFGDFSHAPQSSSTFNQPFSNNLNFNSNFNTFQSPVVIQSPQNNNLNLNIDFAGQPAIQKNAIIKPPVNTTKNVNEISGDNFFDLL